ncbi:hypothetical protein WSK_1820 [Novosphingobium sp. Rr 2-17]|uniref:hypothetical protein n=1 Tax=Novosphingobium sp. Rr 2-17 TaxID=555793 RepID=UPI000269AB37|nr:hypothetical protein [Novosphingobium sp. Rr 2-17]EIZ79587.1 hypothetical protein WSK_1820 [Novosphingobium sp. Rr 2-17]
MARPTGRHVAEQLGLVLAGMFLSISVAPAQAQDVPSLEGTWKIATPETKLKPLAPVVLTAEGRKALEQNKRLRSQHKFDDYDIALSRCSNPGVPRLMLTPMRFKIWQRFGVVTFDFEWNRALRQIDVRGLPTEPLLVPQMTGRTSGRWEGGTLVAETVDISDRTLIDDLMPHTNDLKVTERLRLIDADTLEDQITIEDPAYYATPWSSVVTFKRQPDGFFPEHVCLENRGTAKPSGRAK